MDPSRPDTAVTGATRTPIDTRARFVEQLQAALERAQREVWMADRDFADWPLGAPAFESAIRDFLRRSAAHHLRLLAVDASRVAASPRMVAVFRSHAHNAHCRVVPAHTAARFGEACSMTIVDRTLVVRRFHRDHPRGASEFDPAVARPWLDQFESLWEESTPALGATTLGL